MKRLLLTLPLIFGLAYPASGQIAHDPTAPLGKPTTCEFLAEIMEHSQLSLLHLTNFMWDFGYNLKDNPDGSTNEYLTFGGIKPPASSTGDYFTNLEKFVRTVTHAHEMARDAYESACMENNN